MRKINLAEVAPTVLLDHIMVLSDEQSDGVARLTREETMRYDRTLRRLDEARCSDMSYALAQGYFMSPLSRPLFTSLTGEREGAGCDASDENRQAYREAIVGRLFEDTSYLYLSCLLGSSGLGYQLVSPDQTVRTIARMNGNRSIRRDYGLKSGIIGISVPDGLILGSDDHRTRLVGSDDHRTRLLATAEYTSLVFPELKLGRSYRRYRDTLPGQAYKLARALRMDRNKLIIERKTLGMIAVVPDGHEVEYDGQVVYHPFTFSELRRLAGMVY